MRLIEERHPDGLPVSEATALLYGADSVANRQKVYRLARTLRQNNVMAFSFGGIYFLCDKDAAKLAEVAARRRAMAGSTLEAAFSMREKAKQAGLSGDQRRELEKQFAELKKQLLDLLTAY